MKVYFRLGKAIKSIHEPPVFVKITTLFLTLQSHTK